MSSRRQPSPKSMAFFALTGSGNADGLSQDVNWPVVFAKAGSFAHEDIEYTPVDVDGYAVVKMYKPAEIAFGSTREGPDQAPRDVSDDDEEALGRFRETSAAIFLAGGRLVAIIKGGRSAPSRSDLQEYLDYALPLRNQRWGMTPFRIASDAQVLRDEVTGVLSFKTRVTTTRGLFDDDEHDTDLSRTAAHVSEAAGADLQVNFGISFDASPTAEQKRSMRDLARRYFGRRGTQGQYSGTRIKAEVGGEVRELVLEAHSLKKHVAVRRPPGRSVPRFSDLLDSAVAVVRDAESEVRAEMGH